MRRLIVCADDFGRDVAVNEAVEIAHRDGILTCASLMVGAPAAADAIERARRLPGLRVGLHLVLIDGPAMSPPTQISRLVGTDGVFDDRQVRAGFRYFLAPGVRRQLAAEITAQFEAFRATGLVLDHVNAHKHMHVHPTVARLLVEIGRDYGMRAVRVPAEPATVLQAADPAHRYRAPLYDGVNARLRRRLHRAGMAANDHVFGIAWSGGMDEARLLSLLPRLPAGTSELYAHPASQTTAALAAGMPGYRHADELAALVSPAVKQKVGELGIELIGYADLPPGASRLLHYEATRACLTAPRR